MNEQIKKAIKELQLHHVEGKPKVDENKWITKLSLVKIPTISKNIATANWQKALQTQKNNADVNDYFDLSDIATERETTGWNVYEVVKQYVDKPATKSEKLAAILKPTVRTRVGIALYETTKNTLNIKREEDKIYTTDTLILKKNIKNKTCYTEPTRIVAYAYKYQSLVDEIKKQNELITHLQTWLEGEGSDELIELIKSKEDGVLFSIEIELD